MNIAFLVGKFPSLSETFILDQITGLMDLGLDIDIFSAGEKAVESAHPEVAKYRLMERTRFLRPPRNHLPRISGALRMLTGLTPEDRRKALKALDVRRYGREAATLHLFYLLRPFLNGKTYDVLHCHFGNIGQIGGRLKDLGVAGKLVVTFHGYDISRRVHAGQSDLYRCLFRQADLLLPVSEYWRQRLIDLGADPQRVVVHHMGINPDDFPFQARSLPHGRPVQMITTGRLIEKKGIEYGLRAVAELLRRRPDLDIRYDIIGSGPLQETLDALIDRLNLRGCARLLGPQTRVEVQRHIHNAHLYLQPSVTSRDGDQEGIPVSLMEAMASGLPILTTRHTGIPELVEHGVSGLLADEGDVDGLSVQLENLLDHPEEWPAMGRNGRAHVEQHHNNTLLMRELVEIYREL